jgi:tRNA threonylcarbamoyladenosine biosynthesis protein TsaB
VLILAADTSLPLFSVALLRDGSLIGAMALEGKSSRNEKLLPAVDWLLVESGTARTDIELFAVTRGPGSLTGVRIGLATMQGLGLAWGPQVCAMSTHEAVALGGERFMQSSTALTVVDDAGRGEFYASRFEGGAELVAARLATAAEADELSRNSERVSIASFTQHENVAAACARRAAAIAAAGRLDAYADATPIYVRLAEAEVRLQQKRS